MSFLTRFVRPQLYQGILQRLEALPNPSSGLSVVQARFRRSTGRVRNRIREYEKQCARRRAENLVRKRENREKDEEARKLAIQRKLEATHRWELHRQEVERRKAERAARHQALLAEHARLKAERLARQANANTSA